MHGRTHERVHRAPSATRHEAPDSPSFAVVIVSYRTPSLTGRAARSALAAGAATVVVVDNASGDETVDVLRLEQERRLHIIELGANVGFGSACNVGAHAAKADVLLFLNSDAVLTPDAAEQVVQEVMRWSGLAIVAPKLVDEAGALEHSVGLLPRPGHLAIRALGLHVIGWWLARHRIGQSVLRRTRTFSEYRLAETSTAPIDATFVSGACFAIGRDAFARLGGFDERFFMYFEDADLCRRAAGAGMRIRYLPAATVTHVRGASGKSDYPFGPLRARSMRTYLAKWYPPLGGLLALVLLWLRASRHTLGLRPGAVRAWRAFWAALADADPRRDVRA